MPIYFWCWDRRWSFIRRPGFLHWRKRTARRLVIVNREPTPLDGIADVVLHAGIGGKRSR